MEPNMITVLLVVVGIVLISAVGALVFSFTHAPEGYEDASGFHAGKLPSISSKRQAKSKQQKVRNQTVAADLHLPAA
jgi:flagellar basal body-associated protein FliL